MALWVPLNPIAAQTRALTAITLATTVAGQPVTTVTSGTVVTLTGTVTAGTTTLTAGQVNFCVASAKYCADINILGSAQLTSAGTAVMKFRPGRGSHSYKAVFLGTNIYSGSSSGASALTVTGTVGPFATATSIAETGAWGDYTLTGTVTEAGGTVAPTGSLSFLDASNANSVLAIGSLGAAVAGVGWPNPKSLANTQGTYFVLVADLNADGIPDLVLGSNQVSIYLGNANGTYTKGATISVQQAPTHYPIVTADFNEDGIPDLAVPLYGLNDVAILLGKGDGTFEAPIMESVPGSNFIKQIVVGDFNGDGIPDLALIDSDTSTLGILLANGDGTFTQEATKPPVSGAPTYIATGDFNGDGKTDVAVAENDGTIAILLGNGDGTFAALGSVNSGSSSSCIAVADLNGDGRADIVLASGGGSTESIIVLTGNGDGTFNSSFSVQSPTSTNVTWVHVADFNQDGTPDVVLADSIGGATVFLNNGGGSLDKSFPVVSGLTVPYYFEVGVGDLNGDGYPDIVAGGYYNNSQGLYLTEPTETASASASIQVSGVGQHLVQASFPAEGSYKSSLSSSVPLWGLLPATSTTLSVTSGGATVTSVTPATAVLLSAHVSVGTTPVTSGQVNFCDASAPHCTDIHILGSAALSSSGTATFKFVPGSGTHSYRAQFVEDGFGLASASNVASLTVGPAPSPVYSDITAISGVDGFPGDYSLTATVVGYGGPASPTGAVSFVDTSFGNNVLATASLGTGIPGIGFLESLSPSFGSYPTGESTADFNGDGIPDLAIVSTNTYAGGSYTLAVFLGKGDGTFRAGPTIQPSGMQVDPFMIFGDFNGDGKLDLAMLTWGLDSTSYLTILLNNGDSSFTAKPTVVAVSQSNSGGDGIPGTMAAADFNGDGKLDLAVVGDYISAGGIGILLGNGDGTFSTARILVPDQDFGRVAVGDFNGDGIPDLVVTHYFEFGTPPTIFLGKGDGAFTAKLASFTLDYFPTSIVVGDFNGDGILDLAFSDLNGVEIALGNGDGTFNETSASPIQVPDELYSLQAGDFNHDGKLDLAGWDTYFGQIVLLLGAGDGTFALEKATPGVSPSTFGIHQMAAADFNEDGVPDLALLTYSVNTASILLTVPTETSTATVDQIAPIGPGTHNVQASYSGNSTYRSGVSDTVPLFAGLAPIVFTPAAGTYTTPLTITLSESIPGSTIYYSASGIVSTNGFVPYTSPIPLTESGVATILAYATETGYLQSHYAPETFTINLPTVLISNLSPAIKAASSSAFALTVNGLGFTSSSTVNWGSTALSTQYVSATELTAQVPASAIANAGTATLIVQTPGVGSSNAFMFEIDSAGSNTPPNFTTSLATVSRASSANYAVTLPSSASNVSATCLNLPNGATCSYSASTGAITIKTASSTPAGTYQIIVVFTETLPGLASASLFLPILLLPRLLLRRKWAAKRFWVTACLGLLVSAIAIGSGCGGGGNAPAPQAHQVTTSGVVTLTVQ